MVLSINAKAKAPQLVIDYIAVALATGEEVSLNWETSEIAREEDGFSAWYRGVYFGEQPANGQLPALNGMQIVGIGAYSGEGDTKEVCDITITDIEFEDAGKIFKPESILPFTVNAADVDWTD